MKRRDFLRLSMNAGMLAMVQLAGISCTGMKQSSGKIELPPLPYPETALEPFISAKTIGFHYGKHHKGYVEKLNGHIGGTPYAKMSLTDIVLKSAENPAEIAIFNNAAQVFNHAFYWNSMKPDGGGLPEGKIEALVKASFGSYESFAEKFSEAATSQFGSGWAWLVLDGQVLKVMKTANADTPIAHGLKPVLTIDVWEHAYYLDYQNRRAEYVKAVLEHLIDWTFAERNLV